MTYVTLCFLDVDVCVTCDEKSFFIKKTIRRSDKQSVNNLGNKENSSYVIMFCFLFKIRIADLVNVNVISVKYA